MGGNLVATTDAANGVITMDGLRVDGTVQLTTHGSGDATVVNDAGLTFLASTVRNLAATATTGNIVDSGVLTVAGTSSFTTSATDADDYVRQCQRIDRHGCIEHHRIIWYCDGGGCVGLEPCGLNRRRVT